MTTPVPPAISPANLSYLNRVAYLTPDEYLNAPTAVDTSALVSTGSGPGIRNAAANKVELRNVIARASSWADNIAGLVLGATSNTETVIARVTRMGTVKVVPKFVPIIEVDSISLGLNLLSMVALTPQAMSAVDVHPYGFEAPTIVNSTYGIGMYAAGAKVRVQFSYVNGWPNATATASAGSGSSALALDNPLGIYAGTPLMVYDGENTEQVVAAGPAVANVLPLAAPLAYNHGAGVSVSALPPDVKQAVISLTSCLIRTRGTGAMVMQSMEHESGKFEEGGSGALEDLGLATAILAKYRRVPL